MNLKELLKPTISKIILFVFLFGFSVLSGNSFTANCGFCACGNSYGYPFNFAKEIFVDRDISTLLSTPVNCGTRALNYNFVNLVLDIIIWYSITSVVIFGLKRINKH